jgi:UDP-N-acetylglucosamine--N-acetylmuramyl-(pentapeptide) pyrophosphoryl-undecaprenol N-acetylglucosamine transferase
MKNGLWFLPKKPHIKRILFHAINHVGLGHINRSIAVAQWLQAAIPNLQALFLIEGGEDFIDPTGYPWILIPGQASENEHIGQITCKTIEVFQPDVIVHETLLRPAIHEAARAAGVKQVVMGSLGDALRDQLRHNLSLLNQVHLLIVLQQRTEVLSTDQELIAQYRSQTLYAGPLVRRKKQLTSEILRRKLGLTSENKVIFVTFGGGGWDLARSLLSTILAAKEQILSRYPQAKLIAIPGPHFSGDLPAQDDFVCYVSRFEAFLDDYVDIASVVVMMAGYSTVNEIASSGVPAVCIAVSDAEDQVGTGGMGEYAQTFPNITASSADPHILTKNILAALERERDFSAVNNFWQYAETASRSIVAAIEQVLYSIQ